MTYSNPRRKIFEIAVKVFNKAIMSCGDPNGVRLILLHSFDAGAPKEVMLVPDSIAMILMELKYPGSVGSWYVTQKSGNRRTRSAADWQEMGRPGFTACRVENHW